MSLENKKTLIDYVKRSMEHEAINLLVSLRIGDPIERVKEIARKIGTMGESLK